MIAIKYKTDKKTLKKAYLNAFGNKILSNIEKRWADVKKDYPFLDKFKCTIYDLLLGDFRMLIRVYLNYISEYKKWSTGKTEANIAEYKNRIVNVFNYKGYHDRIAAFFMDQANEFDIYTCHYCEISYINAYVHENRKKNHFDLDHVLDKGNCPLLGLSLMNFVPSCQCCNEKIKRQETLGGNDPSKMYKLSPTSPEYDFDGQVKIGVVICKLPLSPGFMKNKDCYSMNFLTIDSDYSDIVKKMHLRERYEYHKGEALRLLDLAESYTEHTIPKIAKLLGYSEEQVREDIFGSDFVNDQCRCFKKLRKDILNP